MVWASRKTDRRRRQGTIMTRSSVEAKSIIPVILSGGSGTRLWPLSRTRHPKQFMRLASDLTLFQEIVKMVSGNGFLPPVIVCNEDHRFIVAEQLLEIDTVAQSIILEPEGRNTAPAVAVAAFECQAETDNPLLLVLPSDLTIGNPDALLAAIEIAASAVSDGALATFGIPPKGPESAFGYIQQGNPVEGLEGCHTISNFAEKPDVATAKKYLAQGGYYWNSGMFLLPADNYLDELEHREPDIVANCLRAHEKGVKDLDFTRVDRDLFLASPSNSIDYAVMEHSENAVVVPVDLDWSDLGSWPALWNMSERNPDGNALLGSVVTKEVSNSYIRSEGPLVAALGVDNLVVVATDDAVLIVPRERGQAVRELVAEMAKRDRHEHMSHPRVHRPWGHFEQIDVGENYQVKRLSIKPGAALSLQLHHHRAEHWVVVNGTATVTRGETELLLQPNDSTYIPPHMKHRLFNAGTETLNIIEVQTGNYLGEDDIVRFEDVYGRSSQEIPTTNGSRG